LNTSAAPQRDRFATSTSRIVIAAIVCVLSLYALTFITTEAVQEFFGFTRQVRARVPTFLVRISLLLCAIAALFFLVTGTSFYKRNKIAVAPWLFLAVGLILFMVYVIVPIFQSISYSFTRWDGLYDINGIWTGEWVGFHNYKVLFDDPNFYTSLWNNVLWLVLFMLAVPIGLFIALFLNQTVTGIRS